MHGNTLPYVLLPHFVFFCYGVTVQVFYESLRMYPPTPAVSRQALCGMKLAGYSIPEGTNILVSTRLSDSLHVLQYL